MRECVKCGGKNILGANACGTCKWPFTLEAWAATTHTIRRITLDTCCINAKGKNVELNQLEQWANEGTLQLQRSPALLKELKGQERITKARQLAPHPNTFDLGSGVLGGGDVLAGPDLPNELLQILFPTAKRLTKNQENDMEHLRQHIRTGGDIFVTLNSNDFITRGRQTDLASFGIWVLLPSETVSLLKRLYGWAQPVGV